MILYKRLFRLEKEENEVENMNGIFAMAGMPFANKKMQISATARMDMHAAAKNTACMMVSFKDFILIPCLYLVLRARNF